MKRLQKGFTLIELLVVIAIIGILSAIVLVNVNNARNSGRAASVQSSLSSLRSIMELEGYTQSTNTYLNPLTNTTAANIVRLRNSLVSNGLTVGTGLTATPIRGNGGIGFWMMATRASNGGSTQWYCADSTGATRWVSTEPSNTAEVCPTT